MIQEKHSFWRNVKINWQFPSEIACKEGGPYAQTHKRIPTWGQTLLQFFAPTKFLVQEEHCQSNWDNCRLQHLPEITWPHLICVLGISFSFLLPFSLLTHISFVLFLKELAVRLTVIILLGELVKGLIKPAACWSQIILVCGRCLLNIQKSCKQTVNIW